MRRRVRLSESDLHRIIRESVKSVLGENNTNFEDKYNQARANYKRPCWGFEMKNQEGDWEYGEVTYDPKTQKMCCMDVCIDVDPDLSVDQNLEGLYEELMNNGYTDGDE